MNTFGPTLTGVTVEPRQRICTVLIWPDQVHVFQALPKLTPEAAAAMSYAAAFITDALGADTCSE